MTCKWILLLRLVYSRCLGAFGSLDEDFLLAFFVSSNLVLGALAAAAAAMALPSEGAMVDFCASGSLPKGLICNGHFL